MGFFRRARRLISGSLVPAPWDLWAGFKFVSPTLFAVASMVSGYVQGIQWAWVMFIGAGVFAFVSHGLVALTAWRQKLRVADKLGFNSVRIMRSIHNDKEMILGFFLESSSDFVISGEVHKTSARIGNRVPSKDLKFPLRFDVPPHGVYYCDNYGIAIDPAPHETLEGSLEFSLKFGRAGNLAHSINMKKQVILKFDENKKYLEGVWHDAVE